MECWEAVTQTRRQAVNLPSEARRLVVAVGSGMSLSGILWGLRDTKNPIPVLAVRVGGDPTDRLDKYAPQGWRSRIELETSPYDYHSPVEGAVAGIGLDPIYEAKALPFLKAGDCFWIIGRRETISP